MGAYRQLEPRLLNFYRHRQRIHLQLPKGRDRTWKTSLRDKGMIQPDSSYTGVVEPRLTLLSRPRALRVEPKRYQCIGISRKRSDRKLKASLILTQRRAHLKLYLVHVANLRIRTMNLLRIWIEVLCVILQVQAQNLPSSRNASIHMTVSGQVSSDRIKSHTSRDPSCSQINKTTRRP